MINRDKVFTRKRSDKVKKLANMNPIHRYTLCMGLVACLLNSVAVESLSLEHSFDGHNFIRVASVDIPEVRP